MKDKYKQYLQYIKNTGTNPDISWFDEDFEPIGPTIREEMVSANLIEEVDGKIMLK